MTVLEMLQRIWQFLRPSIVQIVIAVVILILAVIAAKISRRLVENFFKKSSRRMKLDPTQYAFMKHTVSAAVYILGIAVAVYSIPSLRTISVSILAGAGVLAVIIGFASQAAFSNIVSGIFIVIFKPFRVGDRISILGQGIAGVIEDITLRHTVVRTWENKRVVVPNTVISSDRIENGNLGDEKTCRFVEFAISYDSDIKKAMGIMQDEVTRHLLWIDNRTDEEKKKGEPPVNVRLISFGDSGVNLRAYAWAQTPGDAWTMGTDLNKSIKERFDREGIEIPFPYRTIVYKKDLAKPKAP